MAKCEIPIKVYMDEIEKLIDELKHLQKYKLAEGDDKTLINVDDVIKILSNHIQTKVKGKWLEPSVSSEGVEEWQSCKCSICGHYTTRPYLYYFDYPKFCSECGNPMEGK